MKIKFKLLIKFISFSLSFILLPSIVYGNHIKVEILHEQITEKNKYMDINLNIPQINIENNTTLKNKINENIYHDIKIWKNDLKYLCEQYKDDFEKTNKPGVTFILNTTYSEGYNDNNILSIIIDYYQYTGGAHGLTIKNSYNFSLNENKKLILKDIFNDNYDYKTFINKFIKSEINKSPKEYFDGGEKFIGIKENTDFYFSKEALVIYFQLYEIAPYSSGIREFRIPYKMLEGNLRYNLNCNKLI